ncbi:MAG TPA: DUF2589 domain-containing protein [Thermoanaerobaculia bacterium]|nr:DUF2589 domain-containing protein [Thermoanaerobaculia bacterium]
MSERRATLSSAKRDEELARRAAIDIVTKATAGLSARGNESVQAISTNLVSELNNIDFKKMISGPLQAAVDAQVASSLATVNFINAVGFQDPVSGSGPRELVMVDFTHTRTEKNPDGTDGTAKTIGIKVPLLAMLPIPSLRIEQVVIDFNVKLNSVESSQVSDSLGVSADVKGGWGPVSFKVSASYQRKATTGVEVKKEYALNVNVKAVQDEIPAGLEKILNMLAA